jgi:Xaa-Pro dipeptidase
MANSRIERYSSGEVTAKLRLTQPEPIMLTAEGCRSRRQRFLERIRPTEPLLLADPIHLRYLANFHVDPFSLGADYGGLLLLRTDGLTTLFHDNRLPVSTKLAHVDETTVIPWYDGKSPGKGPRRLILQEIVKQHGGRIHDGLGDPQSESIINTIAEMRRSKDTDEIDVLRKCMKANDAGHAWARQNVCAGMSELEVYTGMARVCCETLGQAAIVYGDFTVSPGSGKRGGPPTNHILADGETLILDYSVVLFGYRSDFTNTLVVGGKPNSEQQDLFDLCARAMFAGERELRAGASCLSVDQAVRGVFEKAWMGDRFPHHAGHGLGLAHPEAPYFVREATETLVAGDVVTLEPGLYVDGVGVRIEHNYLITPAGFERLSGHEISLI